MTANLGFHISASPFNPSNLLQLVRLRPLMERTEGRSEIVIGLIDGPVSDTHPDLLANKIQQLSGTSAIGCTEPRSAVCLHGTFIAGMLSARRGSVAPAICPGCTVLSRPIFLEAEQDVLMPSTEPEELAQAILDCLAAGARILNLSVALTEPSTNKEHAIEEALGEAMRRGAIVVAAAGNQGAIGSTAITRYPWVIPVVGCDASARPLPYSNLSASIGRQGLSAPGHAITSLRADGQAVTLSGTSFATPFVTGAIALLWSLFPAASGAELRQAIALVGRNRRNALVPPLLDAWASYQVMAARHAELAVS